MNGSIQQTDTSPTPVTGVHPLGLPANFAWSMVGNVAYSACQWGIIVALAKLGTAAMVGQFTLALAVTAPVVLFANLQLRVVQATDAEQHFAFVTYVRVRLVACVIALVVIVLIVAVSPWRNETKLIILVIAIAKIFESISDIYWGLMQQRERMDWTATSMLIKGPASVISVATGLWLSNSLLAAVTCLAGAWALTLLCYDIPRSRALVREQHASWSNTSHTQKTAATARRLARLALPLGFVTSLEALNASLPRYVIERALSETALGIFGAISYTQTSIYITIRSIGQSASPQLAKAWYSQDRFAFRRLVTRLYAISIATGLLGLAAVLLVGRQFLVYFYRPEYGEHFAVFLLVIAASLFMSLGSAAVYAITAARSYHPQIALFGATAVTTGIASVVLTPRYGILGTAGALLLSSAVHAALGAFFLWRATRLPACPLPPTSPENRPPRFDSPYTSGD